MTSWVCLDSGIVLKFVLPEADSQQAKALWQSIITSRQQPVAPLLFPFEVTSVLRKRTYRGDIGENYSLPALRQILSLQIQLTTFNDIHEQAWQIATHFNRPAAYDAHYLALAEHLSCEFWTADKRLSNAVNEKLPWVRWLGDFRA
jgi:predicted nucleic acid-binding protein